MDFLRVRVGRRYGYPMKHLWRGYHFLFVFVQFFVIAEFEFSVGVAEVHSVAFAEFPNLAVGTFVFLHPFAIAVWLEFVFPHFPKVVFVDIALVVVATDAGACRYATIAKH